MFVITPTVDLFTYVTSAVSEGVRYYADGGSYLQSVIDADSCSQCSGV